MSLPANPLKLREEPLSVPKSHRKQWNSSTKLGTERTKSRPKSPSAKASVATSSPLEDIDKDMVLNARALVEKAVESALHDGAPATPEKREVDSTQPNTSAIIHEIEIALVQDMEIRDGALAKEKNGQDFETDLYLEQVRLERARRKIAIQAFRRQIERQMQRLGEMLDEVNKREALMDAAFNKYEWLLQQGLKS
ncbi:hypothetical protein LEN26_020902 [Aphanomyces euteiches]|nr:hypothetical protein LEN26_020902 [Aphanomyces euteiches]KAH9108948.1 hypothetical protein AeMF1_015907 [Aphanomyces euteiches]KAH9190578.1 hypothetical protein AeNC1_007448 [Aphanomyces euteiches]